MSAETLETSVAHRVNYIPTASPLNWDEYFMLQAITAGLRSKDPNTKVGCVLVDEDNHQISMGYNGMVAGIDESQIPWGSDTSVPLEHQKYGHVIHAESNALLHATTRDLRNARLFVVLFPCNECAKLIAGKKIKEVIYLSDKHRGREYHAVAKKIFDLSGVAYRRLSLKKRVLDCLCHHAEELMRT